jgi:hypothetical protein
MQLDQILRKKKKKKYLILNNKILIKNYLFSITQIIVPNFKKTIIFPRGVFHS